MLLWIVVPAGIVLMLCLLWLVFWLSRWTDPSWEEQRQSELLSSHRTVGL